MIKGLFLPVRVSYLKLLIVRLNSNWHFRLIEKDEDIYPFVQAICGYYELCYDKKAYENIIVEKDEESQRIYFRRKIELEKELALSI